MNPSSSTPYHIDTNSGPSRSTQPNQHASATSDDQFCFEDLANWGFESIPTATVTDYQRPTSTAASSSSLGVPGDTLQQDHPPQWPPSYLTVDQQEHRQGEAILPDFTNLEMSEELCQALLYLFPPNRSEDQAGSESQPPHTAATQHVEPPFDFSSAMQPDLLQSASSSVSTSSSIGMSDPSVMFNMLHQPARRPSSASDRLDEHAGPYISGPSDGQAGQGSWIQQPQQHPHTWAGQNQSSDTRSSLGINSSSTQQARTQPPTLHHSITQQSTSQFPTTHRPPSQHSTSRQSTTQQSTQQPTTQYPTSQHSDTQQSRAQHPQITDTYRIVQPEAPARLVPHYVNRHPLPQDIESPMISPLTVPPGDSFQAHQVDAMDQTNSNSQTRPAIGRTRRRSAIYYRHGRTVADSLIEVFEDGPENSASPDVGSRNRTTSYDSTLQARKPLGEMTNRAHTVSGPAASRGRTRKQSAPISSTSKTLAELPVALSNLAWVNNGVGPCSTRGPDQQRDAHNVLDSFREGRNDITNGAMSRLSVNPQSRKSSA